MADIFLTNKDRAELEALIAAKLNKSEAQKYKAELEEIIADGAKIQRGSYVGTGVYGSDNPNILTFNFVPKFVWLFDEGTSLESDWYTHSMLILYGITTKHKFFSDKVINISYNGATMEWYLVENDRAGNQWNTDGKTYYYIAVG